jgi:RND family efflux transporter MFP subunit
MPPARQIALSVAVLLLVAGGWFAYDRGWFATNQDSASAAQSPAGGPAGGGGSDRGRPGGGGFGGSAPAPVVTAAVEIDDNGLEVQAVGTVAAARAITLYPDASGVVAEVAFRSGTEVVEGQPLVRLGDSEQQIAVERARVALDSARLALERAEQLAQSNNITTAALAEARTNAQRAEIDLRGADLELARRTLFAPFSGTIGLTDVTLGDLLNSSRAIATLDDMSTVTVAFEVPERASGRVVVGQEIVATTAALAGRHFTGHVSAVDSRVDPVARTLKVEASLPNEANVLKPGMALNVALAFEGVDQPAVASLAVQWDRSGPYVWKVEGDSVVRVGVDIVGRRSGVVIVAAGDLAAGDEVVVEGLQRLRAGSRVLRLDGNDGVAPAASPEAGGEGAEAEATAAGRRPPSG